jgi:hypothetical protein
MMDKMYMTGYSGAKRTENGLLAWSVWARFDPEFRRRLKMLMDASIAAGRPVGIGGGWRASLTQKVGFLDRHEKVLFGGCCKFEGARYKLKKGRAHMAPPGMSYHESTTKDGKCLAVDMVGDMKWMTAHCEKYGLIHFGNVNGEEWHLQPIEIPHSRSRYSSKYEPLKPWAEEVPPPPAPPKERPTIIPEPVIELLTPYMSGKKVAVLQQVLTFWGWYPHTVDGWAGPKTIEGIKKMQEALKVKVDGIYGPVTATAYAKWLSEMPK